MDEAPLCECGCGQRTSRIKMTSRAKGRVKGEFSRFVIGHAARAYHRRLGDEIVESGEKFCPQCGEIKPLEEFPISKQSPSGRYSYCKLCKSRVMREAQARWKERHPDQVARSNRVQNLKKRGLTIEEYEQRMIEQDGRCAICLDAPDPFALAVDHNHATNKIRALLCRACNMGLGHFRENPEILERAAVYLRERITENH